jgi:5-methylthioadenosine/S-adenosylhomocysteine deaminase
MLAAAPLLAQPGPGQDRALRRQLDAAIAECARYAGDPQVEVGIGPHSAYVLPVPFVADAAAAAREAGALLQIHVAESKDEGAAVVREYGASIPRVLGEHGVLEGRVLAAHCVWMDDADLAVWREHDVAVAHCPQSNAKLACGIARLADMLAAGIRVGVATDGPASNNNLDLWEELRLAAQLARLSTGDPQVVPAAEAFWLAAAGAAAALGRADIGALEAGRWADFVHVDTDDAAFVPIESPADVLSHLVWSAGSRHVRDVWVGGRQVVFDGECRTVDEAAARADVQRRALRLAG